MSKSLLEIQVDYTDSPEQGTELAKDIRALFVELILDQPMIGMQKGLLDTNKVLKAIDEL